MGRPCPLVLALPEPDFTAQKKRKPFHIVGQIFWLPGLIATGSIAINVQKSITFSTIYNGGIWWIGLRLSQVPFVLIAVW